MIARAALLSLSIVSLAVLASACSSTSSSDGSGANGNGALSAAGDGVGSTLGGCPENEAADGASCDAPGRACFWKRSDGARATGWCTAAGTWRVVAGPSAPCPETPTTHQGVAAQPPGSLPEDPATPECQPGLTCVYPSTPFGGAQSCSCTSAGLWNSLCEGVDDGWKEAPSTGGDPACSEGAACGGISGCGSACSGTVSPGPNGTTTKPPGQTTKSCGCAEDGHLVCSITSCGG